jgi:hypothetical protein
MNNTDNLIRALADKSGEIEAALGKIGYKTLKIDLSQICAAADGIYPDVHIWARKETDAAGPGTP